MNYPAFFDRVETITLEDKLSDFLGTFENGIMEFSYLDIVKSAGHSCPTVAGAYLVALSGLKALYPDERPKRGEIGVYFRESEAEGVTGVIASLLTQITGATESRGFKGIGGKFRRCNLMGFDDHAITGIKFERLDTNERVEVTYDPSSVPGDPAISLLLPKMLEGTATVSEQDTFKQMWQSRVQAILENKDAVIKVTHLCS
jgi:hypothetical protein